MRVPGFADRLCPRCYTWTVHRILTPRKRWQCLGCEEITERGPVGAAGPHEPRRAWVEADA